MKFNTKGFSGGVSLENNDTFEYQFEEQPQNSILCVIDNMIIK